MSDPITDTCVVCNDPRVLDDADLCAACFERMLVLEEIDSERDAQCSPS